MSYKFSLWYEGFILLSLRSICSEETAWAYFRETGFHVSNEMIDVDYSTLQD